MITRLVEYSENGTVYIGREGRGEHGYFGNPHVVGRYCALCEIIHLDNVAAVAAFQTTFDQRIVNDKIFRRRVLELKGQALWCPGRCVGAGKPCHGQVYIAWLEAQPL